MWQYSFQNMENTMMVKIHMKNWWEKSMQGISVGQKKLV
jgi:hypothetical protein